MSKHKKSFDTGEKPLYVPTARFPNAGPTLLSEEMTAVSVSEKLIDEASPAKTSLNNATSTKETSAVAA